MPIRADVVIGKGTRIWHAELVNIYGCVIGVDCKIGSMVEIGHGVVIGDRCMIQAFTYIPNGVTIGNDVFIGPRVTFLNDKYPPSNGSAWGTVVVEDGVSIGGCAVILPSVTLGARCRIGAGAVVTKDVLPGSLVVGNPAKVMRGGVRV